MSKKYTFTALVAFLFFLSACQKESISTEQIAPNTPLSTQQRLDMLAPPLVIFQYSLSNLETGEETGWIVDRSGKLKTYKTTWPLDRELHSNNENWNENDIANLYAIATETVSSVALEELLSRVHQGNSLSKKFLTTTSINEDANWVEGFYAFSVPGAGCSADMSKHQHEHNHVTGNAYDAVIYRQIVHLSGYFNRYETSSYAIDLHRWMIEENEQF